MRALIVVDVQRDFCEGGALAVPNAGEIIPIINQILDQYDVLVATKDWHPHDHGSFASNNDKQPFEVGELDGQPQIMWPDHCVQGTDGAEFHSDLDIEGLAIFTKGENFAVDSYSGFSDNGGQNPTGLEDFLRTMGVDEVYVCGLATDYCVKATAIDATKAGFKTHVLLFACRGLDNVGTAKEEMRNAGVIIVPEMRSL